MTDTPSKRFEIRFGKYGAYFHDNDRGGSNGVDMTLNHVLNKLNRLEDYTKRLGLANKNRKNTF